MGNILANSMMLVGIIFIIFAVIAFLAGMNVKGLMNAYLLQVLIFFFIGIILLGTGRIIKKARNKVIQDYEVEKIVKSEIQKASSKEEIRKTAIEEQRKKMENGEITQEEYLRIKKAIEEVK
jgi:energy-coupling factor transporter transmembrane protein EcfT